jgi:anaerobic ribonucleoside-triphosphate reductase activating protein
MSLRIHSKLEASTVNGPGNRAVIWVQGCTLACPGCWNPETHPSAGGEQYATVDLISWLVSLQPTIEGLTISGGEPIEQLPAVTELVNTIRLLIPNLSIGMFSGYSEQELETGRYRAFTQTSNEFRRGAWAYLKTQLDFAVLGRYNALQPAADPLVTSANQKLRLFSDLYAATDFSEQSVEFSIDPTGLTQITGFPVRGL